MDPTENVRRAMVDEINEKAKAREEFEKEHGQVWDTAEVQRDFSVLGFMAPFVLVRRLSDNVAGTLTFQHWPRLYWGFEPAK